MSIDFARHQELIRRTEKNQAKKKRPCLMCGTMFITTPTLRTCCHCSPERDQMGHKAEQAFVHTKK